ncbi:MAG: ISAs1 family transposase [Novosphingobium sp.]|nr:ISAs1 family transposase [Novosphingobium sp.]
MKSFAPILKRLEAVPDPRRAEGKRYALVPILLFSILAIVTGANSYRGIETFIAVHRKRLNKAFGLRWRQAPAHTSIRSILIGLAPSDVEAAFRAYAADLDGGAQKTGSQGPGRVLAIDGKTLRGSFDAFHDSAAKQVLSAFAADTMLILAHIEIDAKSNEIPAAQQLLAELDVAGRIVTLDALHAQKTFEAASAKGIHLIVQLKANQKSLCRQVRTGVATTAPLSQCETEDADRRNRHETRTVTVFDASNIIASTDWCSLIAAVIRVERRVLAFNPATGQWKTTRETSFYLSNKSIDAELAGKAIRDHWRIENSNHHLRDVTLDEDRSRIRTNPGIFARLRSFAANILRFNQKRSIRQDRYANALGGLSHIGRLAYR